MKKRSKGLSLSYIYFIINSILTIVVSAFIVRKVGQTNYGIYQTMTAFAAYLVLLEFGTGSAMSRNLSLLKKDGTDQDLVDKNISTIWSLTVVLAMLILLFSIVFYFLIDKIYANSLTAEQIVLSRKLFIFVAINLVFTFLTQTLNGLLLGYEYYSFEKTVSLIRLIIRSVVIVLLMIVKPSVFLIVVVDCAISGSVFLFTLLFCIVKLRAKFVFKYFDKNVFKFITPLCLAMLLQTLVNSANGSLDKFLISIMMTPDDVSIYAIAMTMFSMFSSVGCIPLSMYMPQVAGNMKNGMDGKELTEMLVQPCRLNTLILSVLAFGIVVVGKEFLVMVYGSIYSESWLYALIVIFPMLFNMYNGVIITVMDVLNKRHIRSFILMFTTILNVIMTIIGIKIIGMLGAAIATGVSLVLQTIILNIYYKKKMNIDSLLLFKKSFKGILDISIISTGISFPLKYLINNIYLQFFVCGATFCVIFFILFVFFGANKTEEAALNKIKMKLIRK